MQRLSLQDLHPKTPLLECWTGTIVQLLYVLSELGMPTGPGDPSCSLGGVGHCFWPFSQGTLQYLLKELILDSRVFMGKSKGIPAGSHQFRKFAASYSQKFLALSSDHCEVLRKRMGCKSLTILGKVYIDEVPSLSYPCAVPLGTVLPNL